MCGIIGYTGKRNAVKEVVRGLRLLEYRGYDSAGLAAVTDGGFSVVKAKGRIGNLEKKLAERSELLSATAIGHTRWATHGAPSDKNSHPHGTERVLVAHNGIIENYAELRETLAKDGYRFESETDTEVAAKLIDKCYAREKDPVRAIRAAEELLRGTYAFAILFFDRPHEIYAARRESPLLVGVADDGCYLASDIAAFLSETRRYHRVENGEILSLCKDKITFYAKNGDAFEKELLTAEWDIEAAERGGYQSFMEKEMHEEPKAVKRTLSPRVKDGLPSFSSHGLDEQRLLAAKKIVFVACGTAYHAGLFGRHVIEKYARIPCEAAIASEFRYSEPILSPSDAVIVISQSGETADTLAALRLAKQAGAYTVAVVNVAFSSIARESDCVLQTLAGPEIAVASTKAYTVQTALLALLGVRLAYLVGRLNEVAAKEMTHLLSEALPTAIEGTLSLSFAIRALADEIKDAKSIFFIGRNQDYVSSLEGSLKLKEISYIHSEAYAAGELKHGTISLIEEGTPVIALSTVAALREKTASNLKETTARGAAAYVIADANADKSFLSLARRAILLPSVDEFILPIVAATALQLLAFHTADLRGTDVDKPRNLAKSVTVE